MKVVKFGDMLTVEHGIIVHGCNAQGVMGSGIAADVRATYPDAYLAYVEHLQGKRREETLGDVIFYDVPGTDLTIANAITQLTFGKDGKKYVSYRAIQKAFDSVIQAANRPGAPREVHYPLIGAGLGGGDWAIISQIIDACFGKASPAMLQTLWIYEP